MSRWEITNPVFNRGLFVPKFRRERRVARLKRIGEGMLAALGVVVAAYLTGM